VLSIVDSSSSTSPNEQVFKNVIGTIVSPNYPEDYGNHENRLYKIVAPTRSEILLIVNDFNVEHHSYCNYDFLQASAIRWE